MARPIRFLLNGQRHEIAGLPPSTTVLDWLRTRARLTGTKEGCAEGDCGACTIVTATAEDGALRLEAVNSCLMILPQLDGKAVLTVEGLSPPEGPLHPVQRALVEADASQCGFCTPGIVMALYAFHHGGEPAETDTIHDVLAGNLCRCTGYRPIVDAAKTLGRAGERFAETAAALAGIAADGDAQYACDGEAHFAPASLAELVRLRAAHPDARVLAGGTDLGLLVSKDRERFETTISVAAVPELRRVIVTDDYVEIGAAVTYTRALPVLDAHYPGMGRLIRRIGSRQIRNLGTVGGNIANASPIGDMPPALIALDATLILASLEGTRALPLEDFFLGYRKTALAPGEVIEAVRIPRLAAHQAFRVYKISKRFDQDISSVVGAFRLDLGDGAVAAARIAYGGMAATPRRAAAAEAELAGRLWTEEAVDAARAALADDFRPISDHRAGAAYRARVAANLLARLHLQTAGAAGALTEVFEL